jgi:hypothetical protein
LLDPAGRLTRTFVRPSTRTTRLARSGYGECEAFTSRGAPAVLLGARLAEARSRGCDLPPMVAATGSVAYTRTKWQLRTAT